MMPLSSSLLATKLFVVRPRAMTIERPRLMRLLDRIPDRRLTLISASAGFGKTTLLASWIAATGTSAAWVSLDAEDNNPARFLAYLVGAWQTIEPTIGRALEPALQSGQLPPLVSLLTPLVNDLASLEAKHLLVLEDYHLIEREIIHEGVQFLMEHLPPSVRLVIATRVDPPIPLSRMRVRGELLEIRAADLQFTSQEAAEFLSQRMGLQLSADQVARLTQRTEGWPAGIQMAALSLQGSDDVDQRIDAFTGLDRFVLDFLLEEVLAALPAGRQQVMLDISILRRFSAPLCEAVSGCADGAELLEELERANLFLIPLDNHREWYRYHQLFADLLQHRLRIADPGKVRELHRRASLWFEKHHLLPEALEHARDAGDQDLMKHLLEKNWRRVLQTSSFDMTQRYLATLSDEIVESSPELMVIRGWDLFMVGLVFDARRLADRAEPILEKREESDERRELLGQFAVMRALVASNTGDAEGTFLHARRALELVHDYPHDSPNYVWYTSRPVVKSLIGIAHEIRGEYAQAEAIFAAISSAVRGSNDPSSLYVSLSNEARTCIQAGRYTRAAEVGREMLQVVDERTAFLFPDALPVAHQMLAIHHMELFELENAAHEAEAAVGICADYLIDQLVDLKKLVFDIYLLQKRVDDAERLLQEIEAMPLEGHDPRLIRSVLHSRAKWLLARGDAERGLALMNERGSEEKAGDAAETSRDPIEVLLCGRLLLAAGKVDAAVETVGTLYRETPEAVSFMRRLNTTVLYAAALGRAGAFDDALDHLSTALRLASPERVARPFAQDAPHVAPLLERFIRERRAADIPRDYLEHLCRLCRIGDAPPLSQVMQSPALTNSGELTTREMEILQLMALGYTNRKIADKLYVSVNTVKTHASNLFDKLGASNRIDALVRAREAKILES